MQGRASCVALLAVLVVASGCAGSTNHSNAAPTRVHTAGLAASTAPSPVSAPASAIAPPRVAAATTTTTAAPVHAPAPIVTNVAPPAATTPPPPPPVLVSIRGQVDGALRRSDGHECSDISSQTLTRGLLAVSRTGSTAAALTVTYRVAGLAGDYAPVSGRVTIPAGASGATINVDPIAAPTPAPSHVHRSSAVSVALDDGPAYDLAAPSSAAITLHFDLDQFGCPSTP
jgi:hypothetical protein